MLVFHWYVRSHRIAGTYPKVTTENFVIGKLNKNQFRNRIRDSLHVTLYYVNYVNDYEKCFV